MIKTGKLKVNYINEVLTLKLNYLFSALIPSISIAVIYPIFPAFSQPISSDFTKLQTLLEERKWHEANEETLSLIRNDPANISCPNLSNIDRLWNQYSKGKYGFTQQLNIWLEAGGLNCKTCEDQIQKFSKKVGWNLSQTMNTIPGDFVGQYPTVANLGWQSYVDSDKSLFNRNLSVWQTWKVGDFNLFSIIKNCPTQPYPQ